MNPFKELIRGITKHKGNITTVSAACSGQVVITITIDTYDKKESNTLLAALGLKNSRMECERLRDQELAKLANS